MSREEWGVTTLRELDRMYRILEAQEMREDFRAAQLCTLIANVHRDRDAKSEPFTPLDFVPGWERKPMSQLSAESGLTDEEKAAAAKARKSGVSE